MIDQNNPGKPKKSSKKRFIAGAVCPRCSEMDRIVNYQEEGKNYRECVSCGFKDEIRLQSAPSELITRVSTAKKKEVNEEPVKFIQPQNKNKK
ncbi:YheV family putative zinc ribbon protein [Microbulbifer echini]|uniref:YheV family putative zinc ribbon protein n=1 Tax=Microbulbifer echini TaxID=1529067 RepID=A0ABV4NJI4_9GAMM|nr:YheV family putative zinc ribbon protein [uncultured Microbulbifer sp.]